MKEYDSLPRRDDNRLTSTFIVAALGLDLLVVALSTCRGVPAADASENRLDEQSNWCLLFWIKPWCPMLGSTLLLITHTFLF